MMADADRTFKYHVALAISGSIQLRNHLSSQYTLMKGRMQAQIWCQCLTKTVANWDAQKGLIPALFH